jgi:hypothetical protein
VRVSGTGVDALKADEGFARSGYAAAIFFYEQGGAVSFFWKGRLGEKPSDLLKHYYAEQMREPLFLEALHWWD